jgi:hypothetical protein
LLVPIYNELGSFSSSDSPLNTRQMLSKLFKVATLCVLGLIGIVGLLFYQQTVEKDRKLKELAAEVEAKKVVISRIGAERRVADLIVTKQTPGAGHDGHPSTEVLFQEYDRDGRALAPRFYTVGHDVVHVSGLVIKFEQSFVEEGEDLRGRSILLFDKIYGDHEGRENGQSLDKPGLPPTVYNDPNPRAEKFERELWGRFWQMANDASQRKSAGVDVAYGQSVFLQFKPGKRYTVRLQNNGGPLLEESDLPADIRAAMIRRATGGV